ncbi:hypothetical protein F4801DRAFT_30682 [Xylaria longipes]|nr:hypothetical protein F4801DRAFT_30682 [Xylaria longipes]
MADIVGTVGSIVGIVDVGLKLAMTLHTYVEAVAEAKEQLGEVASDVDATAGALKQLHTILESDKAAVEASKNSSSSSSTKGNYPTPASTRVVLKEAEHQNIETLAVRCEEVYVAITVLVNKAAGLQAGDGVPGHNALAIAGLSLRRRLKWPWLRPRIARCQETLQGLKITLMLHLSIANLAQLQIAHQSRVPDTLEDERNLRDIAELLKNKQVEYNKKADFTAVAGAPAPNIASNDSIPRQARQVSLEASQHFRHLFMHKDRQSRPTIAPVEGHRLSSVLIPTQLDNLPPLAAKAIHFETSAWAADFAAGDTQDPTPVNNAEYAAGVQDSPATTEAVAEVDSRITSSRVPAKSDQEPRARSDIEDNLGPDTTTNAVDDNDGDVGMYAQIDMMEDVRNSDEILEAYIIDPDTTASRRLEFSIEQLYHSLKRTQKLVPQSLVERFMAISPERRRHIQKCLARANFDLSPYHGICLDIFVQPPSAHGAADDGIVVFLKRRKTGFNLVRLSDSSTMRKFDVPFENCRTWEVSRAFLLYALCKPF